MKLSFPDSKLWGVSLVELLIVIGVITVLAAIVLPRMTGLSRPAEFTAAREAMERVNRAVNLYKQSVAAISVEAAEGFEDEAQVLQLLQEEIPGAPGSPFLDPKLRYPVTSESDRPRGYWDGEYFRLRAAEQSGAGLDFARPSLED